MDVEKYQIEQYQKGKLIKEMIGGVLHPLGFKMEYINLMWMYTRQVTNSVGDIIIQKISISAYYSADDLSMQFSTNAFGRTPFEFENIVSNVKEYRFRYRSQEDVINILNMFADYLKSEGLEKLAKMSEPIVLDYPRESDEVLFLEKKEEWAQRFIERENVTPMDDLSQLAEWVCERIKERKGKPYSEVKEYLLELTAFYVMEFAKRYEVTWKFENMHAWITFVNESAGSFLIVQHVFFSWLRDDDTTERLIKQYVYMAPKK